jgi:predicted transposase/invertase (TIGR01784 family)
LRNVPNFTLLKLIPQKENKGKFHELKAIIFLAITDFIMFPNKMDYKSDHVILDKKILENDLKDFSFTFLELPKLKKTIDQLDNAIEMWTYFFKHAEESSDEDISKLAEHEEIIGKAYKELDRFSWNEEELLTYEQAEKYHLTYIASMEQKFDEGMAQGEKSALIKVAKNMLEQGMNLQAIQNFTGLSQSEIESLNIFINQAGKSLI